MEQRNNSPPPPPPGGRLEDVVKAARLTPRQVLRVFHAACSAVAHMHAQHPAIIHRDIKVGSAAVVMLICTVCIVILYVLLYYKICTCTVCASMAKRLDYP